MESSYFGHLECVGESRLGNSTIQHSHCRSNYFASRHSELRLHVVLVLGGANRNCSLAALSYIQQMQVCAVYKKTGLIRRVVKNGNQLLRLNEHAGLGYELLGSRQIREGLPDRAENNCCIGSLHFVLDT